MGKGVFIVSSPLLELFKLDSMVGYDIHEFRGSYLSFVGGKKAKSAITGQTPRIGTGTRSWYRYPWCRGKVVPVPIDSEGLVPVQVKVVPVPLLPATLFLHIFLHR